MITVKIGPQLSLSSMREGGEPRFSLGDATGNRIADRILQALRRSTSGLSRTEISNLFSRNVSDWIFWGENFLEEVKTLRNNPKGGDGWIKTFKVFPIKILNLRRKFCSVSISDLIRIF